MGFFNDEELASISIARMNFQVVGEEAFQPRPAMASVEQSDFFLGRIREIDASSAFAFNADSETKSVIESMALGRTRFANGAASLALKFDSYHVGQSKAGAFFVFELRCYSPATKIYVFLKYDYSEVVTLRGRTAGEQLRRVMHAFVKDKKALQKSALIRVVNGCVETDFSATDRGAVSPGITDFFTRFLGAVRQRDDVELNAAANLAIHDIVKDIPENVWGAAPRVIFARLRESLRTAVSICDDAVVDAVMVAAGRPADPDTVAMLRNSAIKALKKRKIFGLTFPPSDSVFRSAAKRKIRTVENIKIEYPDDLDGVKVDVEKNQENGTAVITIRTQRIEVDEVVNESIGNIRKLAT
ncbi:hypothetical protein ACFQ0E_08510 [Lysobacter brunescens]|uniref:Nucleoid-associated protein n=2 Tax=Lysobacter brunescens TaxID=262323 RepID=A0ABW2YEI1_9GAMM